MILSTNIKPKVTNARSDLPSIQEKYLDALEKIQMEIQDLSTLMKDAGRLPGFETLEFKAGIVRMANYHAKSKSTFAGVMKSSRDAVFTGALAGNVRKNKLKKKSESGSDEVKKAH